MSFNIVILFAFLAMLFWGVGDFLIQRTTRRIGSLATLTWIGIVGTIGLLPLVWRDFGMLKEPSNLLLLSGLGLVTFVSGWLCFAAFKEGKISVIDVILILELPFTIILSIIFLKESLSAFQSIVVIFMLLGVALLAIESYRKLAINFEKGVILALSAALFMGGLDFFTGVSSRILSPGMAIWAQSVFSAVLGLIWLFFRNKSGSLVRDALSVRWLLLWTCIIDVLAWLWYAYATKYGEISITTAITESYPAIAIALGVIINREKVMPHQWFGAALAIMSSIVLSFTI